MLEFAQFCLGGGGSRPIVGLQSFLPMSAARWTNRFPSGLGWERSLPLYGATELPKLTSTVLRRTADPCTIVLPLNYCSLQLIIYLENIFGRTFIIEKKHFSYMLLKELNYRVLKVMLLNLKLQHHNNYRTLQYTLALASSIQSISTQKVLWRTNLPPFLTQINYLKSLSLI
jgi:hypothetical protein